MSYSAQIPLQKPGDHESKFSSNEFKLLKPTPFTAYIEHQRQQLSAFVK